MPRATVSRMTHDTLTLAPVELVTPEQYAELHGISIRTMRRYLAAEPPLLEGARQLPDRSWLIPADAPRPQLSGSSGTRPASSSSAVERHGRPAAIAPAAPQLSQLLEQQPAYLDVDTAAQLLGIPAGAIRRNRARFEAEPYGPHGALVVPQGVIRRIAGLA